MGRQEITKIRVDFEKNIPTPLVFKYQNNDKELITVKIDRIRKKDINNHAGNRMHVFQCETRIDGAIKLYELRYELDTCRWFLCNC